MKADLSLLMNNFSKILVANESISIEQQDAFIEKVLEIHEIISISLAKSTKISKYVRGQALSLIDKLDGFLESLEDINKFYCYYYHVLLNILESYEVDIQMD